MNQSPPPPPTAEVGAAITTCGKILPLAKNPGNPVHVFGLGFAGSMMAVGWSDRDGQNAGHHAFTWTMQGGTVDIGSLGKPAVAASDFSTAYAISEYADVVVGASSSPSANSTAFRYTLFDATMRDLGSLIATNGVSSSHDVNFDGSVVVGSASFSSFDPTLTHAFRWVLTPGKQTGAMTDLDPDTTSVSAAYAVNDDGSVVVGTQGLISQAPHSSAFIWSQRTGMIQLGALPGHKAAVATGVSRDGTTVVGTSDPNEVFNPLVTIAEPTNRPFVWTAATGMQDLNVLGTAAGLNPSGLTLLNAAGITRDGRFIYGNSADAKGNLTAYLLPYCGGASCASPLVAAVLPASRSVQVGQTPATAFATIINTGSTVASGCSVQPAIGTPAGFNYQTTDPATNALTGSPNTPVGLAPSASQSFVFSFAPTGPFAPSNLPLVFGCAGQFAVAPQLGLNTLLLSASPQPVPDIIALAASAVPGIVEIPGTNGAGAFAVATANVGAGDTITATANTGSATLPIGLNMCQTDPAGGNCITPIGPSVTTTIAAKATPTFAIFASGSGTVPFDPANNRIFVQFADAGGVVRGSTSVAIRTK